MGLFGKEKDLRPQVREMQTKLRRESRLLDREIASITQQMKLVELQVKKNAKSGNMDEAKVLVRAIIKARKSVSRLHQAKAEMNSVIMELSNQMAMAKMATSLSSSTQVMRSMSNLVKLPELRANMCGLSKEMMKLGIMNEMVDDAMDDALNHSDEEMEEVAQAEIDKILWDVTKGTMGQAPSVVTDTLPAGAAFLPPSAGGVEAEDEDVDIEQMRARLEAIR